MTLYLGTVFSKNGRNRVLRHIQKTWVYDQTYILKHIQRVKTRFHCTKINTIKKTVLKHLKIVKRVLSNRFLATQNPVALNSLSNFANFKKKPWVQIILKSYILDAISIIIVLTVSISPAGYVIGMYTRIFYLHSEKLEIYPNGITMHHYTLIFCILIKGNVMDQHKAIKFGQMQVIH